MSAGRHRLPARLELTATVDDTTTNLKVDGELDSDTVDHFERTLDLVLAPSLTRLVLDFGPLTHLGSDGIYVLMAAHQRVPRSVTLAVVNCPEHARQILQVSGLFDALVQPDEDIGWLARSDTPGRRSGNTRQRP
jgi:anti-anti-sigma factor